MDCTNRKLAQNCSMLFGVNSSVSSTLIRVYIVARFWLNSDCRHGAGVTRVTRIHLFQLPKVGKIHGTAMTRSQVRFLVSASLFLHSRSDHSLVSISVGYCKIRVYDKKMKLGSLHAIAFCEATCENVGSCCFVLLLFLYSFIPMTSRNLYHLD